MYYSSCGDVVIASDDLIHHVDCLMFRERFFVGKYFSQIAIITKLGYNVCVVFGGIDVKYFDNVIAIF